MNKKIISSHEYAKVLCRQLGIESAKVSHIVIDVQIDKPVQVYVTMFGTEGLLDVKLPDIQDIEITVLDAP